VTPAGQPPDDLLTISAPEQYRALGHPLRHRLMFALGQQTATISQLAAALGSNKGNIAHHLRVLREAGLVRVAETRQVRGGTEQYYQRTARQLRFVGDERTAQTAVMLQAVADEIATATAEPVLVLRNLRLTEAQAERLGRTLADLADDLDDAGDGEPRFGLLLGLYRPRQPAPDPARRPRAPGQAPDHRPNRQASSVDGTSARKERQR
jgi:DNA-binding transcriptional ArsR family regulator